MGVMTVTGMSAIVGRPSTARMAQTGGEPRGPPSSSYGPGAPARNPSAEQMRRRKGAHDRRDRRDRPPSRRCAAVACHRESCRRISSSRATRRSRTRRSSASPRPTRTVARHLHGEGGASLSETDVSRAAPREPWIGGLHRRRAVPVRGSPWTRRSRSTAAVFPRPSAWSCAWASSCFFRPRQKHRARAAGRYPRRRNPRFKLLVRGPGSRCRPPRPRRRHQRRRGTRSAARKRLKYLDRGNTFRDLQPGYGSRSSNQVADGGHLTLRDDRHLPPSASWWAAVRCHEHPCWSR